MYDKTSGAPILSTAEYDALVAERDRIDAKIKEYEQEHRRGCVKVITTKGGFERKRDVFSIRYDANLGRTESAYWKTIFTGMSIAEVIDWIEALSRDLPAVLESLKERRQSEQADA